MCSVGCAAKNSKQREEMAAPRAQTIESDVSKSLDNWITAATSYMDAQSFEFKSFQRSVDKLNNADAYAASLLRATVFQFAGDIENATYWINNMRALSRDTAAPSRLEAVIFSNLGYFSQASKSLKTLDATDQVRSANMLYLSACYPELVALRREHSEADGGLEQVADLAEECQMTLDQLKIRPDVVREMLDLAGEVLRKHRLFFIGQVPVVHALGDCFLYELKIDVEPAAATDMTDEVIAMMVERDLDVPGLSFSFVGTKH